jgi:hypothetical protein
MANRVISGGIKTDSGKNRKITIHPIIFPYVEKYYKNQEKPRTAAAIRCPAF